jgi:hypothetical protein
LAVVVPAIVALARSGDSDFGGGGTNVKGFTLSGTMALSKAVRCSLRWMSADEVAGPPLSSDILQVDLNAKF